MKTPLPSMDNTMPWKIHSVEDYRRHVLFCGTEVVQTKHSSRGPARAVVLQTGASDSRSAWGRGGRHWAGDTRGEGRDLCLDPARMAAFLMQRNSFLRGAHQPSKCRFLPGELVGQVCGGGVSSRFPGNGLQDRSFAVFPATNAAQSGALKEKSPARFKGGFRNCTPECLVLVGLLMSH